MSAILVLQILASMDVTVCVIQYYTDQWFHQVSLTGFTQAKNGHTHRLAILGMRNILASTVEIFITKTIGKSGFCHKNSNFNETIEAFCCFVLISRKWISLDIFNNKWDNKYQLNAAKRENHTRRSGVRKEPSLCRQSQKQIKKLSHTDSLLQCFVSTEKRNSKVVQN